MDGELKRVVCDLEAESSCDTGERPPRLAKDVPGGIDAGLARAQSRTNGDATPIPVDADGRQVESLHCRCSSRRDKQDVPVEGDLPPVVSDRNPHTLLPRLDAADLDAGQDLEALLGEVARKQIDKLRLLRRQHPREHLHHRHVAAETVQGLPEFECDRPGADDE